MIVTLFLRTSATRTISLKPSRHLFVLQMNSQDQRRACSEISQKLEKLVVKSTSSNPPRRPEAASASEQQAVKTVRCSCCGVAEDCTAAYIRGVRASFCGDWLCGLCASAVKETVRRDPASDVAAALVSHEAECKDFNSTTRMNPTLSLAGSMRRIARRSFERRVASYQERRGGEAAAASRAAVLARSASCHTWFPAELMNKGPAGDRCSADDQPIKLRKMDDAHVITP
jgi:hypothetical protein